MAAGAPASWILMNHPGTPGYWPIDAWLALLPDPGTQWPSVGVNTQTTVDTCQILLLRLTDEMNAGWFQSTFNRRWHRRLRTTETIEIDFFWRFWGRIHDEFGARRVTSAAPTCGFGFWTDWTTSNEIIFFCLTLHPRFWYVLLKILFRLLQQSNTATQISTGLTFISQTICSSRPIYSNLERCIQTAEQLSDPGR